MTTRRSAIVGVFSERTMAERAIEALHRAGFRDDQIRYSGHTSGGNFFESIKNWFTGQDTSPQGFVSDLKEVGISDAEAQYYANEYNAGRPIVAVKPDGRWDEALAILRQQGSYDYGMRPDSSKSTSATQTGYTQTTGSIPPGSTPVRRDRGTETEEQRSIRLREEMLQAEKQRIQTGEVTLHKEVVIEQKTIEVPVQHEEVVIERHPVSGEQVSETPISEGEVIRIPVSEEQVHITKTPVVTGEVSVSKRTVEEEKEFTGTVQREELHVERKGNAQINEEPDRDRRGFRP